MAIKEGLCADRLQLMTSLTREHPVLNAFVAQSYAVGKAISFGWIYSVGVPISQLVPGRFLEWTIASIILLVMVAVAASTLTVAVGSQPESEPECFGRLFHFPLLSLATDSNTEVKFVARSKIGTLQ